MSSAVSDGRSSDQHRRPATHARFSYRHPRSGCTVAITREDPRTLHIQWRHAQPLARRTSSCARLGADYPILATDRQSDGQPHSSRNDSNRESDCQHHSGRNDSDRESDPGCHCHGFSQLRADPYSDRTHAFTVSNAHIEHRALDDNDAIGTLEPAHGTPNDH